MDVLTSLRSASRAGLSIRRDGTLLRVAGPRSADQVVAQLRQHKGALLEALFLFEERAALMEYEGCLPRAEAEPLARASLPRMLHTMAALLRQEGSLI
jgi:hypothetical protein